MGDYLFLLIEKDRQLKKRIIRLGCGIDISKDKFHVCFGVILSDSSFVIKGSKSFSNDSQGITLFVKWVNKYQSKYNPDDSLAFQIVMETTGVYHERVCKKLHEEGLPVCLEVAARVKKYLQSIGQYSKTDKLDARGICQLACERKLKLWKPFSPNILKIRATLRHRKALIENKNRLTNQLHALEHGANLQAEISLSLKRVKELLQQEIKIAEKQIKKLYKNDEKLSTKLDPIIDSIKGLGLIGALTVVAETNGFAHICNAKQLASYAGYDIIENQSGNQARPTRISKRGNSRIRRELYMCVLTMSRYEDGPFSAFFARIQSRNPKYYKVANVAVQRKLLLLIYALFKNGTKYEKNYGQKTEESSPTQDVELREIVVAEG